MHSSSPRREILHGRAVRGMHGYVEKKLKRKSTQASTDLRRNTPWESRRDCHDEEGGGGASPHGIQPENCRSVRVYRFQRPSFLTITTSAFVSAGPQRKHCVKVQVRVRQAGVEQQIHDVIPQSKLWPSLAFVPLRESKRHLTKLPATSRPPKRYTCSVTFTAAARNRSVGISSFSWNSS